MITVRWSRRFVGGFGPGRRGGTCRRISLPGRRSGGGSTGGPRTGPGTVCWLSFKVRRMPSPTWSGWSRSTPPWRGRTSMPPEHASAPRGLGGITRFCGLSPRDHALGRSRGGWSTKTHLSVDRRGRPLSIRVTPGQAGDNPQLLALIDDIGVPARGVGGRSRSRPDCVIADKAYSHPSTRRALRRRGIRVVIPERSDQIVYRATKGSRGGRPPHLQLRPLPRPERRRASVQPTQGLARHRHPLRQTRPQLPSRRHRRLHRAVLGSDRTRPRQTRPSSANHQMPGERYSGC